MNAYPINSLFRLYLQTLARMINMEKVCSTILALPYSIKNVEKLVELINEAKVMAEKNQSQYPVRFISYLQNNLQTEVQQLINDKEKYVNTGNESLIIATFTTLKLGIHHFFSKQGNIKLRDLHIFF